MTSVRLPFVAAIASLALLTACTSGSEEQPSTSSVASDTAQPSAAPGGFDASALGLTGQIAYVSDGVAQVQDGSSQTAVRYDGDTAFTKRVTLALSDVAIGQCVLAVVADDAASTTITVTDAVDGSCDNAAPGGMGGFPGGTRPGGQDGSGQASGGDKPALPSGAPTVAPSDLPSGGFPSDGAFPGGMGSFVVGTVSAVAGDSITVTASDGTVTDVAVAEGTTISGQQDATSADVVVGQCMTARGTADDAGGYDADSIQIFGPGDDGCMMAGFGGMGGRPGDGQFPGNGQAPGASDQQGNN